MDMLRNPTLHGLKQVDGWHDLFLVFFDRFSVPLHSHLLKSPSPMDGLPEYLMDRDHPTSGLPLLL